MAGLEIYQEYPVTVAAGEVRRIDVTGTYIRCLSSNIDFAIGVDANETQFFTAGLQAQTVAGEPFKFVEVDNRGGGSTLTASLAIGSGDLVDSRLTVTAALSITKATTLDTVADVSCATVATTIVLAALTTRRVAYIQNLDPTAVLRVGDSNTGAARGLELAPGALQSFATTEAIHIFNPAAGAVLVAVAYEAD